MRRYARDTTRTDILLCTFGADEMVKVGDFWIDRYEATITDTGAWNAGRCDELRGRGYGSDGVDDYPGILPDNGNFTAPVYACSVANTVPSRMMTWFQAQQSCALAGKRLCRNDEWQAAVAGTPDPGATTEDEECNVSSDGTPAATGSHTVCVSRFGAFDMIGNLWEWVAYWSGANGSGARVCASATYGEDCNWSVTAAPGGNAGGMPAAADRGGAWVDGAGAGAFALDLGGAPSHSYAYIGARCCAGE